jgi:hypothetical protein
MKSSKIIFKSAEFCNSGKTSNKKSHFQKKLAVLFFMLCAAISLQAQGIQELNKMMADMKSSGNETLIAEAGHIQSLITDLQPTVYVGNTTKASGETLPVRADVKAGSVAKLYLEDPLFEQVEMITIRINTPSDLATTIDLSAIQGFKSLKYVRILCSFECSAEQVSEIVSGNTTGIKVCYFVSILS